MSEYKDASEDNIPALRQLSASLNYDHNQKHGAKRVIEHGFARMVRICTDKKSVGIRRIRVIRVLLAGMVLFHTRA